MKSLKEFLNESSKIKKGSTVLIKPEYSDDPDNEFEYEVIKISSNKAKIRAIDSKLSIPPIELVNTNMITLKEEISKGGLADGMTIQEIADMHKVSLDAITKEFDKGVKVEMEHTDDEELAQEIAKDHLYEDPEYYTKLATIEGE
jgi:hypothetical protein